MYLSTIVSVSLPVLAAMAAPHPQADYTHTVTATTTTSAPITYPTDAIAVLSARSGSPVHLLPMNAAGLRFWLGGNPATYCPTPPVENCPPGNVTAFAGLCSMDVEVPGGQQTWVAPDGSIGFTQAHSVSRPQGSNPCPFTYTKTPGSAYGYLGLDPEVSFGASSFMACPTDSGSYQVFAALQNATVPQGDASQCLGFDALAEDYVSDTFAAWQYT